MGRPKRRDGHITVTSAPIPFLFLKWRLACERTGGVAAWQRGAVAPVVEKLDRGIYRINHYPVEKY